METLEMKTCSRCKSEKPVSEFAPSPRSHSGYMNICRACQSAAIKAGRMANSLSPPILATPNPLFAEQSSRELIARLRELIQELKARGYSYKGELTYLQRIKL